MLTAFPDSPLLIPKRVQFPAVLLHNKLMTSEASLGLIPRNSAVGSFINHMFDAISKSAKISIKQFVEYRAIKIELY